MGTFDIKCIDLRWPHIQALTHLYWLTPGIALRAWWPPAIRSWAIVATARATIIPDNACPPPTTSVRGLICNICEKLFIVPLPCQETYHLFKVHFLDAIWYMWWVFSLVCWFSSIAWSPKSCFVHKGSQQESIRERKRGDRESLHRRWGLKLGWFTTAWDLSSHWVAACT